MVSAIHIASASGPLLAAAASASKAKTVTVPSARNTKPRIHISPWATVRAIGERR